MIIDHVCRGDLPALRALWKEAFGDSDAYLDAFEKAAFSPARCRCGRVEGGLVAALYWLDCSYQASRIAYLYAVATSRALRGRGLCSMLMEDTHRHLTVQGYKGAILVPGSESLFEFYGRLGYKTCSYVREFTCAAAQSAAELRRIGTAEYASLRRTLLPVHGVIQEGENLSFLETQADLYAGDGFLLTAKCEDGVLHATELLGDSSAAPLIVRTLGCIEGSFRTPGSETPFAMYRALGDETLRPPTYFGLAFD